MNKMKKTFSFLLALILLTGLFPMRTEIPAYAMNDFGEYTLITDPEKISVTGAYSYAIDASTYSGIYALSFSNDCKWLQINARKYDADWLESYGGELKDYTETIGKQGQGAANLAGAEYTLFYYEGDLSVPVQTSVTDELGYFSFYSVTLGRKYYIRETKAAPGYELDPERHYVNFDPASTSDEFNVITADKYTEFIPVFADHVQRAPITVIKRDSILKDDIVSPQGDATLSQQKIFEIKYYAGDDNRYDDIYSFADSMPYDRNSVVEVISTDEYGVARTSDLPYGWYQITEITSPEGYINHHHTQLVANFEGDIAAETCVGFTDDVERAFLDIRKADIHEEIGDMPEGDATLIGAEFTVQNVSGACVTLSEAQRNVGEHTIWFTPDGTASNGDYIYNTGSDICSVTTYTEAGETDILELPFGTYTVRETAAPNGYLLDSKPQTVPLYDDGERRNILTYPTLVTFRNTPQSTKIIIDKKDTETWDTAQGDGKINDMAVAIINRSQWPVYYKDSVVNPDGEVCRLVTDEHGYVESDPLPYGTYEVEEIVAPYGYEPVGDDIHFVESNYDENGLIMSDGTYIGVRDPIQRGILRVSKYDRETGDINQGDATFVGTKFEIYNASRRGVYLSTQQKTGDSRYVVYSSGTYYSAHDGTYGSMYYRGDLICTVITDENNGTVSVDIPNLPFGEYEIVETVPPRGYYINDGENTETGDAYRKYFQLYDGSSARPVINSITYSNAEDSVKRGKVTITKTDDYTGTAEGKGTLAGAEFSVINRSAQPVFLPYGTKYVDDPLSLEQNLYYPGETAEIIYTDENGFAETSMLPYGTYEILESGAPEGYLIGTGDGQEGNGNVFITRNYEFHDGVFGEIITEQHYEAKDSAIRGDIQFQKKNTSQNALSNVVFRITSLTTGESHIAVTDENGEFNSASEKNLHTLNTNANDNAIDENGNVDESMLDTKAGIWFTGLAENELKPLDARGALPYDTYLVEELRSSANRDPLGRDLKLLSFELQIGAPGYTVDYGTLTDLNPVIIESVLTDHTNGTHISTISGRTVLDEQLYLHNLEPGKKYTIETVLTDSTTGEEISDPDGNRIATEYSFTAQSEDTEGIIVKLIFDSGNLSGKTVTAKDTVIAKDSKGNTVCATLHDPASMSEMEKDNQSVYFPGIKTVLTTEDGSKICPAADTCLIDTVYYEGLERGTTYELTAVLMNPETRKIIPDTDGNAVTANTVFTAESADGSVEVRFEHVDLSRITGGAAVCFERLSLYPDGRIIAIHEDLTDADQTVAVPKISTNAMNEGGYKCVCADETVTVTDRVTYENLVPGLEYTLTGTLYLKDTNEPFCPEGENVTVKKTFVPDTGNGEVELEFSFKSRNCAGKALVVFETVSFDGEIIVRHENIDDIAQTIWVPEIRTEADTGNEERQADLSGNSVITDRVSFKRLQIGETYTVSGILVSRETGKAAQDKNGVPITGQKTFTVTESTTDEVCILSTGDGCSTADGYVEVELTGNIADLDSGYYVVYETLNDESNMVIAKHEDPGDEAQTVLIPIRLRTTATGGSGEKTIRFSELDEIITIRDSVEMTGLVPGEEYTLTGTLMIRDENSYTGNVTAYTLLDSDRKPFEQSVSFTAESENEIRYIDFEIEASYVAARHIVVFEKLMTDGKTVGKHEDIYDEDQTVFIPSRISSHLYDSDMGSSERQMRTSKNSILYDDVSITDVKPGADYTIEAYLADKSTGEPAKNSEGEILKAVTLVENNRDTGSLTFRGKPNSLGEQNVRVKFAFDSTGMEGKVLVAMIRITDEYGDTCSIGQNLNDELETVYIPEIRTTLTDGSDHHELAAEGNITLTDTVEYRNLTPGKTYILHGTLTDKDTGKQLPDKGSENAVTFKPEKPDGMLSLDFTVNTEKLEGKSIVAFEELTNEDGRFITEHKDTEDSGQTVTFPKVRTHAANENGLKAIEAAPQQTVTDLVTYENLVPGNEYTVSGTFYSRNASTGKSMIPVKNDGEPVTAEKKFTADKTGNGSVTLEFVFDVSEYEGDRLTAGEVLYDAQNRIVGRHEDIDDEDQTVYVPRIRTKAVSGTGTERLSPDDADGSITDTVTYENLVPGETYTFSGTLMSKSTGQPLQIDGKMITATETVKITERKGIIKMKFPVNNRSLSEGYIVVFEKVTDASGKEIAAHEDLSDDDQSVYSPARIKTVACGENGEKIIPIHKKDGSITVTDTISYSGLIPGRKYTVTTTLTDTETGNTLKDSTEKREYTATCEFTPEKADGETEVKITADAAAAAGKRLVVYEKLTFENLTVAEHCEPDDEDQTVQVCYIIKLNKRDGITDEPIPDVGFLVSDRTVSMDEGVYETTADKITELLTESELEEILEAPDDFSQYITTADNGIAEFPGIPGHTYVFREVRAPEIYKRDITMKSLNVTSDGKAEGDTDVVNLPYGAVTLTKYNAMSNEPVEGAEIEVRDPSGKVCALKRTDRDGRIYFMPTGPGKYTYRETKAPEGYYQNTDTYTVQVTASVDEVYTASGNLSFLDAAEARLP